jgi:hypothetical protein
MSEPLLTIYKEAQRASRPCLWSGPTLRVDDAGTGPGVSSEPRPQAFMYHVVESLLGTIQVLGSEVVEHHLPRRELEGQCY